VRRTCSAAGEQGKRQVLKSSGDVGRIRRSTFRRSELCSASSVNVTGTSLPGEIHLHLRFLVLDCFARHADQGLLVTGSLPLPTSWPSTNNWMSAGTPFVFVRPFLRHVMRRVHGAGTEIEKEGLVRSDLLGVAIMAFAFSTRSGVRWYPSSGVFGGSTCMLSRTSSG
jgi:hypothetical protein